MALIKLGALAQDARGSIAGVTFSKTRAGSTARQKTSPVQPSTARQKAIRSNMATTAQAWRGLSTANQNAWTAWGQNHPTPNVFGDPIKLAGNASFQKVNADQANIQEVWFSDPPYPLTLPLLTPPADPTTPPAAALSVSADTATGAVTVTTDAQVEDGGFYAIWVTRGYSTGKQFVASMYRLVAGIPETTSATTLVCYPASVNPRIAFLGGQQVSVLVVRYAASGKMIDETRLDCVAAPVLTYTATAFGSTNCNGVSQLAGYRNGFPQFQMAGGAILSWNATHNSWILTNLPVIGADIALADALYSNGAATPTGGTWTLRAGVTPAGTISS